MAPRTSSRASSAWPSRCSARSQAQARGLQRRCPASRQLKWSPSPNSFPFPRTLFIAAFRNACMVGEAVVRTEGGKRRLIINYKGSPFGADLAQYPQVMKDVIDRLQTVDADE